MKSLHWKLIAGSFALSCAAVVFAKPVLDRLAAGEPLRIGYRESSIPFSYINSKTGKPVGYALDLCLQIAEVVKKKAGVKDLPIELVMVTSGNRIDKVAKAEVDLECGSTTNNAERRKKVAFTVPHFIAGARFAVRSDSPVARMEDLEQKKLVSTKGSTPLKAAVQANRERLMRIDINEVADHSKGLEMVENGQADAFIMDDVLLYGLISNRPNPTLLKVVGNFLTTEPLAIMLSKDDPGFKKIVDDEMRRLIQSREIYTIYDKWFAKPIPPSNKPLNLPPSYLLKDFWKYPTDQVPF
jgi:ABC-type amino acid transport substrate-binding protein